MKKVFSIIAISLFVAASFSSCEKCMTCTYSYFSATSPDEVVTEEELCGSQSDLDAFEAGKQIVAAAVGTEAVCTTE